MTVKYCLRFLAISLLLAGLTMAAPSSASEPRDASSLLDKLIADNAVGNRWDGFKKNYVGCFNKPDCSSMSPYIRKLADNPSSAMATSGSFASELSTKAAPQDFLALWDAIGRNLGFQVPDKAPEFTLTDDPDKLIDSIYAQIEIAGNEAVVATNAALFKNDRFTTYNLLFTTVYRLAENIYLNQDPSDALARQLGKTKAQLWVDVVNSLRNSTSINREYLWRAMRNMAFLAKPEVQDHIMKVLTAAKWPKPDKLDGVEGSVKYFKKYPAGRVIVGDIGKTLYKKPAALIIDIGGNDEYTYAASTQDNVPASFVLDLSGNDIYRSEKFEGWTVGGVLGVSLLIDREGMDVYNAARVGCGAGLYGASVLLDMAGNDRYSGGEFTCGAAMFGIGVLWDVAGDDSYKTGAFSQGFGGPDGFGLLLDTIGNDTYESTGKAAAPDGTKGTQTFSQGCGFGFNPLTKDGGSGSINAYGGLGYLVDSKGNDHYEGGYCSQGTGFYNGLGMLYDAVGDDIYKGGSYSQGAALFASFGLLIDRAGNDQYTSTGEYAQGCAFDAAIGWLLDEAGKDIYTGVSYAQGLASHNGVGLLFDLAGSDSYKAKEFAHAEIGTVGAHYEEDWPTIGMLVDFGAEPNVFAGSARKDKTSELRGIPERPDFVLFLCSPSSFEDAMKGALKIQQ
ncbi:MAG: hypothetical protein WC712_05130 [Candidatus Brocadiia bacterium]